MKIFRDGTETEVGGALEAPKKFQIAASKEAFRILSSGLYNDKILAIIRELCCNAYDAHVAAGKKDVPFVVHLPTHFEPYFEVKDYGVGLAHNDVMDLYTTYFASNRSDSNLFVGAMGLGSKSPFCYTEGFVVTSRHQGWTRTYAAFIDDGGTPNVVPQSETETPDEPNGLTVHFPVNNSDCWEFENKAKIALEFFDPKPHLNLNIPIVKQTYTIRGTNWGLREDDSTHQTSRNRAIQGMVQYAVGNIDQSRMSPLQQKLNELPLDLFFPIGELSVAASRETLSNDDRTIDNILKTLTNVEKEMIGSLKTKLSSCKTWWEARLLIGNMENQGGLGGIVKDAYESGQLNGTYGSFTFVMGEAKINELDYPNTELVHFTRRYRGAQATRSVEFKLNNKEEYDNAQLVLQQFKRSREVFDRYIKVQPDAIFVVNDVEHGGEKYVHYLLQVNHSYPPLTGGQFIDDVYMLHRKDKEVPIQTVIKDGAKLINALGNPPSVLLSELKKLYDPEIKESNQKAYTNYQQRKFVKFNPYANLSRRREGYETTGWRNGWELATSLPASRKYYIAIKNLQPTSAFNIEHFKYAEVFGTLVRNAKTSGEFDFGDGDEIYGLREDQVKNLSSEWVEFTTYVFSKLQEIMTIDKVMAISIHLNRFNRPIDPVFKIIAESKPLSENSPMQIFCNNLALAREGNATKLKALAEVVQVAQKCNILKVNPFDFRDEWERVREYYPMVKITDAVASYGLPPDWKNSVIDYIKIVDKANEKEETPENPSPEIQQPTKSGINEQLIEDSYVN